VHISVFDGEGTFDPVLPLLATTPLVTKYTS